MEFNEVLMVFMDISLLFQLLIGTLMGIVFGCIPGLNTAMALALALPLTYSMEMIPAIGFLLCVYCGGLSGGSISAILLNIPGTAAAITTTFDGYPMAKKGESMRALSLAVISSFFGGIISALILTFCTSYLANFALGFGSWEYFGAAIFSLALIATLIKGSIINGFISTGIGILLSMIGPSPIDGKIRFDLGLVGLSGGINIVVIIIGVFAVSELIYNVNQDMQVINKNKDDFSIKKFWLTFLEFPKHMYNVIVSAIIGTVLGILPGLGGSAASMMAYSRAKSQSKNKELFGYGAPDGIIAPEAANNAVSGGAMIPAIALGVPGSSPVALIMSAFLVHGVTMGPLVITEQPHILQSVFIALIIGNIFMLLLQGLLAKYFAQVITIPKYILFPTITSFCAIGTYIVNGSMFNVYLMLIIGLFALFLSKNGFPLQPIVMGFTLGAIVEEHYRKAMIYYGSFGEAFNTWSIGTWLVILAIIIPFIVIVRRIIGTTKSIKK
ncbi:hypothetical protein AN644_02990 [Candidatus Epulonipiscium fishelsonii]|nr:hypothetical protein AN644_02990 [Epulopiscium sp. SCG-C06WGA-EpuloA1]